MSATDPIRQLIAELSKLPGVGEKSATRLAFHLLRGPKDRMVDLANALLRASHQVRLCSTCMTMTEQDPCGICADLKRDDHLLCVVATPSDIVAIDRGGHFRGRYHVLHGLLSPLEGIGPDDLKIRELVQRVGAGPTEQEVILALSPNVEGEATSMYLAKLLRPLGALVSRIATGLPVGGELEYTDQATIARALLHRSPLR